MIKEIRFSGFGGQGIIRSGYILGKACALFDDKHATMTQSFGPEARGSACSAQVVVSDSPVLYPYVNRPHVLVVMSQEAYDKFISQLDPQGMLLLDEDLVGSSETSQDILSFAIPATRMAEKLGNKIVANLVMLGFFSAVTGVVSPQAMQKAIPGSVPDRALELNQKAFQSGYEYGLGQLEGRGTPDSWARVKGASSPQTLTAEG